MGCCKAMVRTRSSNCLGSAFLAPRSPRVDEEELRDGPLLSYCHAAHGAWRRDQGADRRHVAAAGGRLLPAREDRSHARTGNYLTPKTLYRDRRGDKPFIGHMLDLPKGESKCGRSVKRCRAGTRACHRARHSWRLLRSILIAATPLPSLAAMPLPPNSRNAHGRSVAAVPVPGVQSRFQRCVGIESAFERYRNNKSHRATRYRAHPA